jgi:8-oxo-dGTP diphosphatase
MMPHIHDKIDFVVSCFIGREGKALLVHHRKLNTWLPVGGHVELDQTTDEAMDAEIKQECGLEVEFLHPPGLPPFPSVLKTAHEHNTVRLRTPWAVEIHDFPGVPDKPDHRHLANVYFATARSFDAKLEASAHNAIEWFTHEKLDELKRDRKILDTIWWYAHYACTMCFRTSLEKI